MSNSPDTDGPRNAEPPISLRRSLFLRFAALTAGSVGALALAYVLFGLQPVTERIARGHFSSAVDKVEDSLHQLFNPVVGMLGISREWALNPGFDINHTDEFNRLFQPVLRQFPQITSVVAGNTLGHGWMLLELPDNRWRNRFTDVPRRGKLQRFVDWGGPAAPVVRDETVDYDARTRPWFVQAMLAPADGSVHWTEPYTFFTTRDPGITGSTRVELPGDDNFVIGFDIKLLDISRITSTLALGRRGGVMVLTDDGRVLGMPRSERAPDSRSVRDAVLKPVETLGITSATDAVVQWRGAGRSRADTLRFASGGEDWLAAFRPFQLGRQTFWMVAHAPLADFVPPWGPLLLTLCGIMGAVLLLSMYMAHRLTRQFSVPLEALVESSERIARLDFSAGAAVNSRLTELRHLATAQERMRGMLRAFRETVDSQAADLKRQISALRATEARLEHLSQHDPLTDLPNRVLFNDRLRHAITRAHRSKNLFAVLFIDLDNFKTVNDTRGHEAGDQMLVDVAQRLRACVREEDSVARLGGDEFIVLIEDLSPTPREAAAQAEMLAEKIRAALANPYVIDGHDHHTTASIGVTLFRGENETADLLMRSADGAMYRAKRSGRNVVQFFDPAMQAELDGAARLEMDLRHALPRGELALHLQPQYDRGQRLTGAEVLLRWNQPERGMVSPAEFIPIAEESGLILPIGLWVIEAACLQLKKWGEVPGTRGLRLAVNVSARQFRHASFIDDVKRILRQTGANGRLLMLELTEGVVIDDVANSVTRMHELKALGITLSMDDFGTGYSSLSYLSRLPLDEVKIDQSFVRMLGSQSSEAVIVHAIIAMARSLNMVTIAEGVESREQFEWLVNEGCDGYQGYLFSRPLPLEKFEALVLEANGGVK